MSALSLDTTVGQLVTERPVRARVFERLGIDYCCGGGVRLEDACARKGLDPHTVLTVLGALEEGNGHDATEDATDWSKATLTELADHIEATHHTYLREALPRLTGLVDKVASVHGERHPRLVDLRGVYAGLRGELESHLAKEEQVLFPICRTLESAEALPQFHCGSVQNPIRVMVFEHDNAGGALATIRQLTDDFTPPAEACNTYRAMLDGLAELEGDIHQHIHKENNILFPRAIAAEEALAGGRGVARGG